MDEWSILIVFCIEFSSKVSHISPSIAFFEGNLFRLFLVCWTFEPDEDLGVPASELDYYLFGSPDPDGTDIFLISQWSEKSFG